MKYLLIGGNGYLGKYIVNELSKNKKNKIIVADYNIKNNQIKNNIEYKYLDITKCNSFLPYINDVDVVIHLACTIIPSDNFSNLNKEIEDNVFSIIKLLDDMIKFKNKKLIFFSSGGSVYGHHNKYPILETEETKPICNYGIIKLLSEKYIELYNNKYNLDYRIIRLSNIYSEKIKSIYQQGIIPIIIDKIYHDESIVIWGDGENIRDYIYIDDAINAIHKIIDYSGNERVFNVATSIGHSLNEVIEIIKRNIEKEIKVEYVKGRKCDVNNNVLDINRISKELNWTPTVSLEEGIKKIILTKNK